MPQHNKKVDDYIQKSENFAKSILEYLRQIIHETCPEVDEDVKWGTPHYGYKGDHLLMLGAFKNHCSFSIYKAEFLKDEAIAKSVKTGKKFGYMDKLKSVDELPAREVLVALIQEAMTINEQGIKKIQPVSDKPKVLETPDYFLEALNAVPEAKAVWDSKSDSFRKDYLVWIIDAKTDATRQKRMVEALEWIADGKGRFWQYNKK